MSISLHSERDSANWRRVSFKCAATAIAAVLVREGLDYAQSKAVFKAARARPGLRAPPERRGGVDRLSVEEELRVLDHAYTLDGRAGITKRVYPHLLRHTVGPGCSHAGWTSRTCSTSWVTKASRPRGTTPRPLRPRCRADSMRSPTRVLRSSSWVFGVSQRGDEAALLAADLLAQRRAERISSADA